jgi:hypothetical protein
MKVFCVAPWLLLICGLLSSQRCRAFAPQQQQVFAPSSFLRANDSYAPRTFATRLALSERSVEPLKAVVAKVSAQPTETTLDSYPPQKQQATPSDYTQGVAIIAFITLLNASLSPVWHTVYANAPPPPLFLNAIVGLTAFGGLLAGGPFLDGDEAPAMNDDGTPREPWAWSSWRGGMELGVWKGLGTLDMIIGVAVVGGDRRRRENALCVTKMSHTIRLFVGVHAFRDNLSHCRHGLDHRQPRSLFATAHDTHCPCLASLSGRAFAPAGAIRPPLGLGWHCRLYAGTHAGE